MTTPPAWQYDELVQIGKDFASQEVVEAYDARHRRFRDVEKENAAIIAGLGVQRDHTLADFGSGTGVFAIQVARHCAKIHAIDISQTMLDYTAWKAQSQGVTNIVFHHGGFLTYIHTDPPLDAITSSMALHHLPDFWKQKALTRLNGMLKEGGRMYLADVVFSEKDYETNIQLWVNKMASKVDPQMAEDVKRHIRKEHSTFTWILEGLLSRAGFGIDHAEYLDGVLAQYYCTKISA